MKSEPEEEVEDVFTDAHEHLVKSESLKAESDLEEVCKSCVSSLPHCTLSSAIVLVTPILRSTFLEASVCLREMADMFLNRTDSKRSLNVVNKQAYRSEMLRTLITSSYLCMDTPS